MQTSCFVDCVCRENTVHATFSDDVTHIEIHTLVQCCRANAKRIIETILLTYQSLKSYMKAPQYQAKSDSVSKLMTANNVLYMRH